MSKSPRSLSLVIIALALNGIALIIGIASSKGNNPAYDIALLATTIVIGYAIVALIVKDSIPRVRWENVFLGLAAFGGTVMGLATLAAMWQPGTDAFFSVGQATFFVAGLITFFVGAVPAAFCPPRPDNGAEAAQV